jgi:hypothetical protein
MNEIATVPVPETQAQPLQSLADQLETKPCTGIALREEQHVSIVASIQPMDHPAPCIADLPAAVQSRASGSHIRNGKIARLPKLERDMVSRLLYNNVPYRKIVGALEERGIQATERNVSNWKTRGGYKEWCDEQERQIHLSRLQDHLTDYIRKNNATQLPEVGLQIAATQLSHTLLQPDACRQLAADPDKYSRVVDMLCRLSTHINTLQKERDENVQKARARDSLEFARLEDQRAVDICREAFTSYIGERPGDEVLYRNDLPKRDELPYLQPSPKMPSLREMMEALRPAKPSAPKP